MNISVYFSFLMTKIYFLKRDEFYVSSKIQGAFLL